MAQALTRRPSSSAVHCIITDTATVQTVAARGVVMLDVQARVVDTDGRGRYEHAAVGLHLADAVALLEQLTASAGRVVAVPETARWGRRPSRAVSA